jgi:hypothetical protein
MLILYYTQSKGTPMENKIIKQTVVVFEHEISIDQFPSIVKLTETELTEFLNTAVVSMFKLKEMEEQINYGGTQSFIRVKDVI